MELKVDVKTLVAGIVLGVVITASLGAIGSADETDFGIALPNKGSAIVRTEDGSLFVVNSENGMAVRVLEATNIRVDPDDSRTRNSRFFNLSGRGQPARGSTKSGY